VEKDLTTESFELLLSKFSPNKTEAGLAYTRLREALVRFFQLKGDSMPDKAADTTLDRVAVKLSESTEIEDITKYSFGVARFIFLERLRQVKKENLSVKSYYQETGFQPAEEQDDALFFLKECLGGLQREENLLIVNYFADLPYEKLIERRRKLAEEFEISLNQLRVKVFRLRRQLKNCVSRKLKK